MSGSLPIKEQRKQALFSLLHSQEGVDLRVSVSNKVIVGQESLGSSDSDTNRDFRQMGRGRGKQATSSFQHEFKLPLR